MAIQDKFNKPNVIYKITKDIDLEGGTLTIPAGCTLDFQGGSFVNGTIIGNNTKIKAGLEKIFNINTTASGIWNLGITYPEWFGLTSTSTPEINSDAIDKSIGLLSQYGGTIQLNGHIIISRSIDLRNKRGICIEGTFTNLINPNQTWNTLIIKNGDYDAVITDSGCSLKNIGVSSIATSDTHDGIWVIGYGVMLQNIGVNNQKGNGIKMGAKLNEPYKTTDCCSLYSVKCVGNKGWGLYISDEQIKNNDPHSADCNACGFYNLDIRDNTLGGIYINKCIDNHFFSPTVQVNGVGNPEKIMADIYIDSLSAGHHFYSAYCESSNANYGIYIAKGADSNRIYGVRARAGNKAVFDANEEDGSSSTAYNYIEKVNEALWRGTFVPSFVNYQNFSVVNPNVVAGPCNINLLDEDLLNIGTKGIRLRDRLGNTASLYINSDKNLQTSIGFERLRISGTDDLGGLIVKNDIINNVRIRPVCITPQAQIPANSTKEVIADGINITNIPAFSYIIASPREEALPSGVSYYTRCDTDNQVKFYLVNSTSATVDIPEVAWNILALSGKALV